MSGPPRPWRVRRSATVRFRVTALATLAVFAVLAATSAGLVLSQRRLLTGNLESALRQRGEELADLLATDRLPARLGGTGDDAAAQVATLDGAVVASSANLEATGRPIAAPPASTRPGGTLRTVQIPTLDDERFRVLSRRVDTAGGSHVLHLAAGLEDISESTGALQRSLAFAVPAVTLLLAFVAWWLVGRALRPVEALRAEVADIGTGDLHRRVAELPGDDEIARLASTMNRMLDRVEEAARHQQRFVADASHELRSPLTRIRAEVEVDLAHPGGADPVATHRSVLEETIALQHLVDDLLTLARSDAREAGVGEGEVDLDDVAREVSRRDVDRVVLRRHGAGPARVRGDRGELTRAIGNLVDNAVRHASGTVTLTLGDRDGAAVVTVEDDGPGIPPGARERVFERFARLDDARSGSSGGTGLGLAIARDIARRHGGDITVDPAFASGARLVMTVPLSGPR